MALWSKKKLDNKITNYFNDKKITYEIVETEVTKINFELCFPEAKFIIYPYLTIDDSLVSFNINIVQGTKNYSLDKLNSFNMKSRYFKAYITPEGLVVLEYRFNNADDIIKNLDVLIQSLYDLTNEIAQL